MTSVYLLTIFEQEGGAKAEHTVYPVAHSGDWVAIDQ